MTNEFDSASTELQVLTAEQKVALLDAKLERVRAEIAALAEVALLLKRQEMR
jgi:hypothetical protein